MGTRDALVAMHTSLRPLFVALVVLALSGCATTQSPPPSSATSNTEPAPAPQSAPPVKQDDKVPYVWGSGWTLKVAPVFSGSTSRDAAGTIRVVEWGNGPEKLDYEFPTFTPRLPRANIASASEGLLRARPVKGTISIAQGTVRAAVFTPPSLWPGGSAGSPGPLIWLSPEVTAALRANKTSTIRITPLPNGLKMTTSATDKPAERTLTVTGKGEVTLFVNGVQTRFPAYRLKDDLGGLYTLLDSPQNPLVVRFRFGSPAVVGDKSLLTGPQSGYDVIEMFAPGRSEEP